MTYARLRNRCGRAEPPLLTAVCQAATWHNSCNKNVPSERRFYNIYYTNGHNPVQKYNIFFIYPNFFDERFADFKKK